MPQATVEPLRQSFRGLTASQIALAAPLYGRLLWDAERLAGIRATDSRGEIADDYRPVVAALENGDDLGDCWGLAGRADVKLTRAYVGRRGGSGTA